jgi:hypothetical protein
MEEKDRIIYNMERAKKPTYVGAGSEPDYQRSANKYIKLEPTPSEGQSNRCLTPDQERVSSLIRRQHATQTDPLDSSLR